MNYLSVCSGIEAATVAWHPLGWTPVAFSEIEKFPCSLLEHHYPTVPNLGDMTKFKEWPDANLDVLVGGTPCQSFSVAGLRKGLADPRGNLTLTYLAIAARYRPEWLVWENVPGVLSDRDGAFWQFLDGLSELGYGWAWRVLDAQFFGVAQRRRRVFVVANSRDWRRAAAVLFERESLSGNPAPRRETGKAAPIIPSRSTAGGGLGTDFDCDGGLVAHSLRGDGFDASEDGTGRGIPLVCGTLSDGTHMGGGVTGKTPIQDELSRCLTAGLGRLDWETETFVPVRTGGGFDVAYAIQGAATRENASSGPDGVGVRGDDCAYEARQEVQAIAFNARQDPDVWIERTGPLDIDGCTQAVALRGREGGAIAELSDVPSALRASQGGADKPHVLTAMRVRRLTPRECERLQGFPDDYTLTPYRGKPAADGPRYKALGNSMAVPVMAWIGQRIGSVHAVWADAERTC